MSEEIELLPCPFCASEARKIKGNDIKESLALFKKKYIDNLPLNGGA